MVEPVLSMPFSLGHVINIPVWGMVLIMEMPGYSLLVQLSPNRWSLLHFSRPSLLLGAYEKRIVGEDLGSSPAAPWQDDCRDQVAVTSVTLASAPMSVQAGCTQNVHFFMGKWWFTRGFRGTKFSDKPRCWVCSTPFHPLMNHHFPSDPCISSWLVISYPITFLQMVGSPITSPLQTQNLH